jgi:hypothetical protein
MTFPHWNDAASQRQDAWNPILDGSLLHCNRLCRARNALSSLTQSQIRCQTQRAAVTVRRPLTLSANPQHGGVVVLPQGPHSTPFDSFSRLRVPHLGGILQGVEMMITRSNPRRVNAARPRASAKPKRPLSVAPDGPRCSVCSRPLSRLPFYLAGSMTGNAGFQCEKCFYPGTGRGPERSSLVASERTRFLTNFMEGGGTERPAPRSEPAEED